MRKSTLLLAGAAALLWLATRKPDPDVASDGTDPAWYNFEAWAAGQAAEVQP